MSSQTPNLNLVLPVGTEKVSRQIINDNNTKIDTAVGSNSTAITNLSSVTNSNSNSTKDIIADALACTRTKFFYGAGANYTGTVPDANYKYGTFIVNVRGDDRHIIAQSGTGDFATNSYRNGWSGWKVVADASKLGDISTLTTPNSENAVDAINW